MSLYPNPTQEYSFMVNNYVEKFIRSHPLAPDEIPYQWQEISPFKNEFTNIKKTGPVYAMHRYWTKQPISVIQSYIEHFCPPKGIVLDPFCGTGTTGTAALYSKRFVILMDISPIATFITKNYTEQTDLNLLKIEFEKIAHSIYPIINKIYKIKCLHCNDKTEIKDWIYSEVYQCPVCNQDVPFISPGSTWKKISDMKRKKEIICQFCKTNFSRDKALFQKSIPIGLRYWCKNCKIRKEFKIIDKIDLNNIKNQELKDWHPSVPRIKLPEGVNTLQPFSRKITHTHLFFTKNTAQVLGNLWKLIINTPNHSIRSKLQFIFSSVIYRVTRLYRLRVNGQGGILSGTLYVPPVSQDINVWDVFKERYRKIIKGWSVLNSKLEANNNIAERLISTQSASSLFNIPNNTVDYVYTDPPYGGNINYSELNLLWEAWFGLQTNNKYEVIINEVGQKKSILEYQKLLQMSLNEIFRVLKPNRWLTLVFSSSSPKIWSVVQKSITNSGFKLSKEISKIESKMTTAKQTESKKTARRYILLNVQKPLLKNEKIKTNPSSHRQDLIHLSPKELEKLIIARTYLFLKKKVFGQASFDEIYDEIITNLLPEYQIYEFNLEKILNNHFFIVSNNVWKLKR